MAKYSVRDILGHFVKPKSRRGDLCPHQCCRNRRVHPDKLPVMLRPDMKRRLPEADLIEHYARVSGNEAAAADTLAAIDKRDQADKAKAIRREQRGQQARLRAFSRRLERQELIEHEIRQAEIATNGNMINARGRRHGVTDMRVFTGSEAVAMKYASGDLLRYWEDHPRPSAGLTSSNPAVVRKARARSDIGRSAPRPRRRPGAVYEDIY